VASPPSAHSPPDVVFALVGDVRASSRALRQLRALGDLGLRVDALTFGPEPVPGEVADGVRLHVLPRPSGRGPLFFWQAHRLFLREALARPASVYHASDLYVLPALAAAARRHDTRLLLDARELYPHVDATAGKPWARWAWSAVEHRYLPRTDAVLTVNDSIADRMAETYGIARPIVTHNVPARQTVERSDALRERLGIPASQRIVLYQGLVRAGRGLERLVDAMRAVPDAALVVIGDGPTKADLQRLAADALPGRAHFLPHTPPDDLLRLTASADLGVHVPEPITESIRLALPNKLFEYLMVGLPVVVADIPEMRRVVNGFDVGLVVDPYDRDSLAAAIRRALADDAARARWAANAPAVFETFRPERDTERFHDVYRRLLAR
jgi:glycosyltransferase involved in cell wall biosynthesis